MLLKCLVYTKHTLYIFNILYILCCIYIEEMDVYLQALDKAYTTTPPPTTGTTKSGIAGPKKEKGLGQPLVEAMDLTAIDILLIEALPFTVRYVTYILSFVLT